MARKFASQAAAVNAVLGWLDAATRNGSMNHESPAGSNYNWIVQRFNDKIYRIGRGAWCDMTVSVAFGEALGYDHGLWPHTGKSEYAYTVYHAQYAQSAGRWHAGPSGIQPGDVVFFDWERRRDIAGIDHVGTARTSYSGGLVGLYEGNTGSYSGGELKKTTRDATFITGYFRPDWKRLVDPAVAKPSTSKPKRLTVDGNIGPLTIKAWHWYYGLPQSSTLTSALVKKVQGSLNKVGAKGKNGKALAVDGSMGTNTIWALQTYYRRSDKAITVDGVIDKTNSATVKHLQRDLNKKIG